jgi:hypothetical protein
VVSLSPQVKSHPVKTQPPDQPGSVILAKEPVLQVRETSQIALLLIFLAYNDSFVFAIAFMTSFFTSLLPFRLRSQNITYYALSVHARALTLTHTHTQRFGVTESSRVYGCFFFWTG